MPKVVEVGDEYLRFDDGSHLTSDHDQDCCEAHYLSFKDLSLSDFEGLEFNLDDFQFERVEGFGIRLIPSNGQPVSVPGYGFNNGYYGTNLTMILGRPNTSIKFDITECQDIRD